MKAEITRKIFGGNKSWFLLYAKEILGETDCSI